MVLVHGLSETLGESMAMRLAHVLHIFQVVSVPAFPCFSVALPTYIAGNFPYFNKPLILQVTIITMESNSVGNYLSRVNIYTCYYEF